MNEYVYLYSASQLAATSRQTVLHIFYYKNTENVETWKALRNAL